MATKKLVNLFYSSLKCQHHQFLDTCVIDYSVFTGNMTTDIYPCTFVIQCEASESNLTSSEWFSVTEANKWCQNFPKWQGLMFLVRLSAHAFTLQINRHESWPFSKRKIFISPHFLNLVIFKTKIINWQKKIRHYVHWELFLGILYSALHMNPVCLYICH